MIEPEGRPGKSQKETRATRKSQKEGQGRARSKAREGPEGRPGKSQKEGPGLMELQGGQGRARRKARRTREW